MLDFDTAGIASRCIARLLDALIQGALLFAVALLATFVPGLGGTIVAIGKEHSDLGSTLNRTNARHPELRMTAIDDQWPEQSFYTRSDHYNFARKGVPVLFFFNGVIFVANSAFNNLGRPFHSTWTNWGRHTIGTIPLALLGGSMAGAQGVLLGQAAGGVVFGLIAWWLALRVMPKVG